MLYILMPHTLRKKPYTGVLNEIAQFTDYITFIAYKTCFVA